MIAISAVFSTTLLKIGELMLFCALGYVLMRWGKLPKDTLVSLSRLLALMFCPTLTFTTFYNNLDLTLLRANSKLIIVSIILLFILCPLSRLLAKKDC